MSMTISFTWVTPDELDRAVAEPEWVAELFDDEGRPAEPEGYLDKSWAGIQFLLDAAEIPVDLRMDGDFIDEAGQLSGWSAQQVGLTAEYLRATKFDQLARHYDPDAMAREKVYPIAIWGRDNTLDYLRHHYGTLVKFFDATAASGAAAIMSFSF